MTAPLHVLFAGGDAGPWRVERIETVAGAPLAPVARLDVLEGIGLAAPAAQWALRATTSNTRYTHRDEVAALRAKQQGLARPEARCAALIPIRKTEAWWDLAQDERRAIMEEASRHISIGLEYLPAIARRLHHGRELGEPFDFLTWFEYAPEHAADFDALLSRLRASEEWNHVDREIDIRLSRDG